MRDKIPAPEPGVYPDVAFEDYAAWDAMNFHTLVKANISTRHLLSSINGFMEGEDTQSRKFGRAIHCAILEPSLFTSRFLVSTKCVGVQKNGSRCGCNASVISPTPRCAEDFNAQANYLLQQCGYQFLGEDGGKAIYQNCKSMIRVCWAGEPTEADIRFRQDLTLQDQLSMAGVSLNSAKPLQFWYCKKHQPEGAIEPTDYIGEAQQSRIERIKSALKEHPVIKMLRAQGGHEVSVVAELDGVLCKARLDKLILGKTPTIVDLKKCRAEESDMESFGKSVQNYHYDQQAAMYCDIVQGATGKECVFKWVVIEDSDDPIVEVWNATDRHMEVGRVKYQGGLSKYKLALKTGRWASYTAYQPKDLLMPPWYGREEIQQLEATIQP